GINIQRRSLAEIVAVLSAPLLVLRSKGLLRPATNALAMPKSSDKVHPLLAAIGAGRTGRPAICVCGGGGQQGDQVSLQQGLISGLLLVLAVADFQHESGILLRDISRQCAPVVKTVVGQLYGILFVGFGPS